ncbi:MAG TPA: class I SAM-dependent methyltransferase [Casimicrobiaceae bacterium]|nr:class I SAM-dependent methyltransferase [Casimicrobiaceae bacterium]
MKRNGRTVPGMVETSATFTGSIPHYYDSCFGPAYLDSIMLDLAQRLPKKPPGDVLELACGTGLLTRRLRERLDPTVRLVATDLSVAMLDFARAKLADLPNLEWREADAAELPFRDAEFGAVVCSFGVMFVPDKGAAFSEMHRVLEEGGIVLFNVWDRIEENPHTLANAQVVEGLFPGDAEMRFRLPYEMYDRALLWDLLAQAQFEDVKIEDKQVPITGASPRTIATGQIRGTPRSLLIQRRGMPLEDVIEKVTAALTKVGGDPYQGVTKSIVVQARWH